MKPKLMPAALLLLTLLLSACGARPGASGASPLSATSTLATVAPTGTPIATATATAAATPTPAPFTYTPRANSRLPEPTWSDLPQWHGFNINHLCDMSYTDGVFVEKEFRLLAEQGFNFARIPLDYRFWAPGDDWAGVRESRLKTLDDAVGWGIQYDIHVSLDLHRAPGYCVNPPAEPESLWTSAAAQRACAAQWAMLARRYRDVPNRNMSFNLLNEPANVSAQDYEKVVRLLVEAIRAEDPDRLIIADGLDYATVPLPQLKDLQIAQALHNYKPMQVTHYMASWVEGADAYPPPAWPLVSLSGYLYGPRQAALASPLTIDGPVTQAARLTLHVNQVSDVAHMQVLCDGRVVFDETLRSTADPASCEKVIYAEQWGIYQNIFNRDYTADIPVGTQKIEVRLKEGDWLTLTQMALTFPDGTAATAAFTGQEWGVRTPGFRLQGGDLMPDANAETMDRAWLREQLQPWVDLKNSGVGVMIGECGVYNQTPHDVTLRYMADAMAVYRECGFGWAVWEYFGSFGIFNSQRKDVSYEKVETGVLLDRKFYEIVKP